MALSPFRAHKQRVIAAHGRADIPEMDNKTANQYELMLMQLAEHRRKLKLIQSIERKIEVVFPTPVGVFLKTCVAKVSH